VRGHQAGSSAILRLEREVRALAELTHPNTVRIFDHGVTEDGLWYYEMELLHGENLRASSWKAKVRSRFHACSRSLARSCALSARPA
jgi:serine/threonine protein kinase